MSIGRPAPVVAVDCVYVFGLYYKVANYIPETVKYLWGMYGQTDTQYTQAGIVASNGWIQSQSQFNVFEIILQLWCLRCYATRNYGAAACLALIVSVATLWKTLYVSMASVGPCVVAHTGVATLFFVQT